MSSRVTPTCVANFSGQLAQRAFSCRVPTSPFLPIPSHFTNDLDVPGALASYYCGGALEEPLSDPVFLSCCFNFLTLSLSTPFFFFLYAENVKHEVLLPILPDLMVFLLFRILFYNFAFLCGCGFHVLVCFTKRFFFLLYTSQWGASCRFSFP